MSRPLDVVSCVLPTIHRHLADEQREGFIEKRHPGRQEWPDQANTINRRGLSRAQTEEECRQIALVTVMVLVPREERDELMDDEHRSRSVLRFGIRQRPRSRCEQLVPQIAYAGLPLAASPEQSSHQRLDSPNALTSGIRDPPLESVRERPRYCFAKRLVRLRLEAPLGK
jgi:hypothetical protein